MNKNEQETHIYTRIHMKEDDTNSKGVMIAIAIMENSVAQITYSKSSILYQIQIYLTTKPNNANHQFGLHLHHYRSPLIASQEMSKPAPLA